MINEEHILSRSNFRRNNGRLFIDVSIGIAIAPVARRIARPSDLEMVIVEDPSQKVVQGTTVVACISSHHRLSGRNVRPSSGASSGSWFS
jgi:hypothetical protein